MALFRGIDIRFHAWCHKFEATQKGHSLRTESMKPESSSDSCILQDRTGLESALIRR